MMRKAFSLIELLIVISITGLLLGLGTAGLLRLRDTMSAEQGVNQFESILKSEKNKAKNNVINESKLRESIIGGAQVLNDISKYMLGTRFRFENNSDKIFKSQCWRKLNDNWDGAFEEIPTCTSEEEVEISGGIHLYNNTRVGFGVGCKYVIFENLTEHIVINTITNTSENCGISIVLDSSGDAFSPFRRLVFDYETDLYKFNVIDYSSQ